MKKSLLVFLFTLSLFKCIAQNVGINQPNPSEALDVNGNLNISGTIKTNGTAGTAN